MQDAAWNTVRVSAEYLRLGDRLPLQLMHFLALAGCHIKLAWCAEGCCNAQYSKYNIVQNGTGAKLQCHAKISNQSFAFESMTKAKKSSLEISLENRAIVQSMYDVWMKQTYKYLWVTCRVRLIDSSLQHRKTRSIVLLHAHASVCMCVCVCVQMGVDVMWVIGGKDRMNCYDKHIATWAQYFVRTHPKAASDAPTMSHANNASPQSRWTRPRRPERVEIRSNIDDEFRYWSCTVRSLSLETQQQMKAFSD